MTLLDTDVMVDLLRNYAPAVAWLESVKQETLAAPGYVFLELLAGCSNRRETDRLLKFVQPYRGSLAQRDCNRAIADFAVARLSRKLGILDVLIAECAVGLGLPLHTFNVKHFGAIPGLRVVQPYSKTDRTGARTKKEHSEDA